MSEIPNLTGVTPETLRARVSRMKPLQCGDALQDDILAAASAWEADQMKAANIIVEQQTHIEALGRVVAAIYPAREATGKFIQHIDGGKPNADRYWELRGAAEEANGKLNDALAALAAKEGR
jgi:hypothetical protein